MSGQEDETDKSHEATPQKLQKAREKGEVAKSADLAVTASYAGLVLALFATGPFMVEKLGTGMVVMLDQSDSLSAAMFAGAPNPLMGGILRSVVDSTLALFVTPAVAIVAAVLAQRAFVFAPDKLVPKLSRISLISNAKNKFGRAGLFEFFKSFVKLVIYSVCLGWFLTAHLPELSATMTTEAGIATTYMARLCLQFLMIVLLVSLVIGIADAVFQQAEHMRKNRMSHKELQDETKTNEGDPHIKNQRRQRGYQIAGNRMIADVATADVVIVNPTHYAVALKWSRARGAAPICVAKGVDEMAAAIRAKAQEAAVPIHHDPPTARALHAAVEIGAEIPEAQYRSVAAAIRFAEDMRRRAKGRA
ncbi:MAG: flagellar type III secretion system protein FlhB [Rhodobacteraceae bacterium]|nr:flagellar type III secretion system protein FlhB [Paracoccaceae bacterium]